MAPSPSIERSRPDHKRSLWHLPPLAIALATLGIIGLVLLLGGDGGPILIFPLSLLLLLASAGLALGRPPNQTDAQLAGLLLAAWLWYLISGASIRQSAGADFAALLGACALWSIGCHIGQSDSLRRTTLYLLTGSAAAFATLSFFGYMIASRRIDVVGSSDPLPLMAGLADSDAAALLFTLCALLALSGALRAIKSNYWMPGSPWTNLTRAMQQGALSSVLFCFSLACLFETRSISGIPIGLGALAGMALLEYRLWPARNLTGDVGRIWLGAFAGLALIAMAAAWISVAGRSADLEGVGVGDALAGSLVYHRLHLDIWLQSPLFGHGVGSFAALVDVASAQYTNPALKWPLGAGNFLLRALVEYGLVGVVLGACLIIGLLRRTLCAFRRSSFSKSLGILTFMSLWVALTHSLVNTAIGLPSLLWLTVFIVALGDGHAGEKARRSRRKRG